MPLVACASCRALCWKISFELKPYAFFHFALCESRKIGRKLNENYSNGCIASMLRSSLRLIKSLIFSRQGFNMFQACSVLEAPCYF